MRKFSTLMCFGWLLFGQATVSGQNLVKQKQISTIPDTLVLDSLSIVPGSVSVKSLSGDVVMPTAYQILYDRALLIWKQRLSFPEAEISYQTFPLLFSKKYFNKDPRLIGETAIDNSAYVYKVQKEENTLFNFAGLNKSGSISRSIGFGNNQDLSVNSNMVLQLSGRLASDIEILAAISDDNIPIQPGGNTQQINDFDKVFIQLKRRNTSLIAGDFELRRPDSYFMNFFKRTQGGSFSTLNKGKTWQYKSSVSAAVAKGRSARNVFQGIEGNQGPYRLTGNNAEQFIIILSGTERVYLDGQLLTRGQENDYVIDYNMSELTFTPRRLITQNSRITVEFEYSDKNYARSLTYLNQEISNSKLAFKFNFYNEQDNPNRPFLQTLGEAQKHYLQTIGNQTSQAFFSNADSVAFNANEVLYKRIDTLGATGVYVYSTNPQLAKYRLGFSFVGQNQGNYRLNTASAANGRVFEFVPPVGGTNQGSYEPISLLVTPKKQQLITLGTDYAITKNTFISSELGFSNNDVNLFSSIGNTANTGLAWKLLARNEQKLGRKDSTSLRLISSANLEITSLNFKAIERYRAVEFERDFNLFGLTAAAPERLVKTSVSLLKDAQHQVTYQLASFVRQGVYNGLQHSADGNFQTGNYRFSYAGNLLSSSSSINKGDFFRQRADVTRSFKKWEMGFGLEQEHNQTRDRPTELLTLNSFSFNQYKMRFASNAEQSNRLRLEYSRRYDKLPDGKNLAASSVADVIDAGLQLSKNENSVLTVSSTYRFVDYNSRIEVQDESTLLGRAEYALKLWKGFVNSSTFYELGTGQEPKREFTYLEVQAGQGAYTWNDYNNNGVKELNEFETARYQDQARYIRIFQPTNQFIKTNYTSVNQTLRLSPALLFPSTTVSKKFFSKLSNQSELKIDRKILDQNGLGAFNPFDTQIEAANLVSLNSYFRNTLFFNRNNPVFGIDLNYQQNSSKILLTNGFDTRSRNSSGIRLRWNIVQKTNLTVQANMGSKRYQSELFRIQNYLIRISEFAPQLDYLLNSNLRLTFAGGYVRQKNNLDFGGEEAGNLRLSTELRYNILKKGVVTPKLNMIQNSYTGAVNSPVSYEMLDGLQPGNNLVWDLGLQRSVANGIQMNINYEGRKSPGVRTIHTAGVQVRAFF